MIRKTHDTVCFAMYKTRLTPRFSETDAFGHINNTVFNVWFEAARGNGLFQLFDSGNGLADMSLILARTEVDFTAQTFYGQEVEIRTEIGHIGNSSFEVEQEAWQDGKLVARGKAVQVHFDKATQRAKPLSDTLKQQLQAL